MKYIKLFENFKSTTININSTQQRQVESICKKYNITNYNINSDGSIDVDGNVDFYSKNLTKLPLKFGRVSGDFNCSVNQLTTLK